MVHIHCPWCLHHFCGHNIFEFLLALHIFQHVEKLSSTQFNSIQQFVLCLLFLQVGLPTLGQRQSLRTQAIGTTTRARTTTRASSTIGTTTTRHPSTTTIGTTTSPRCASTRNPSTTTEICACRITRVTCGGDSGFAGWAAENENGFFSV